MNKPTKAIAALCLLNSANLYALGVGEIETHSALNQVLRAKIPLLSSKNEDPSNVRIGIASREVFKKSGIERPHYLTEIKFTPVLSKNGDISIEVLSNSTIKEPFVNFILEIEWPQGRTLKEFTILLDPPVTMADVQAEPVVLANSSKKKHPEAIARTKQQANSSTQQYGPIKSSDTIWGIAKHLVTSNSTGEHQKMMLALYENNPKAFYKKNINALKKGAILQAPSKQQIDSRSTAQAKAQYQEQNSLWSSASSKKIDAKPSKQVNATGIKEKETEQTTEGKLTLLTASKKANTDVTVEGNSLDTPVGSDKPEVQASMALEMATTLEAENNDVKSRLNDLEAQVEKLHRLVALKDQQLAQLQSTKTTAKKADVVAAKPAPVNEEPLIDTNDENLPLYAGGGLLLALLGIVLARRKKQGKNGNESALQVNKSDQPVSNNQNNLINEQANENIIEDNPTTIIEEEPLLSEFTPSEFNDNTQTQEADPLTECDVYIAYGRYQQAQDIIESALKTDPTSLNYKLKLLDVHFASADATAFEQLAEGLVGMKESDSNGWSNIAGMGAELCPNSPLFSSASNSAENQPVDNTEEIEFYAHQQDHMNLDSQLTADEESTTKDSSETNEIEFSATEPNDEVGTEFTDTAPPPSDEESNDNNTIEFTPVEVEAEEEIDIAPPQLDDSSDESEKNGEFEFDFDLIKSEANNDSKEQASTDNEADFDDIFANENTEDTKISLAQAYIEMEDNASARESLEDVLESGNEEQKQRAQDMLDKL